LGVALANFHLLAPGEVPLSYLRLALAEYRAITSACSRIDPRRSRAVFRRELIAALTEDFAFLAGKVAGLRRTQLRLLQEHLRNPPDTSPREYSVNLSPDEWLAFTEACLSYPLPVRFIGPFRRMLVELFQDASPELARKLQRLDMHQFEQLYDEAVERKKGSA
jgi:hypothetical protein